MKRAHFAAAAFVLAASSGLLAGDPPPRIETQNHYNAPATGHVTGRRNAIVIAHGYTADPTLWSDDMRTRFLAQLGIDDPGNWDVWSLDWRQDASGTAIAPPTINEMRAQMQGQFVASTLLDRPGGNYEHVHLVGHSLGGRVVENAAVMLRQGAPGMEIHQTFLDAYTPYGWEWVYGRAGTRSEHYYNSGGLFGANADAPNTQDDFYHAANYNVTAFHDAMPADYEFGAASWNHNWPQRYYRRTIGAGDEEGAFEYYGYAHSRGAMGAAWPPTDGLSEVGRTYTLALDGETSSESDVARVRRPYDYTVDLSAFTNSTVHLNAAGGGVAYENISFTIPTGHFANMFQFDFMMESEGDAPLAWLAFYVDDQPHFVFDAEYRLDGWENSGYVVYRSSLFALEAGVHELSFRLDVLSEGPTDAWIRGLRAGYLTTVPSPASVVLIGLGALLQRRRRDAA